LSRAAISCDVGIQACLRLGPEPAGRRIGALYLCFSDYAGTTQEVMRNRGRAAERSRDRRHRRTRAAQLARDRRASITPPTRLPRRPTTRRTRKQLARRKPERNLATTHERTRRRRIRREQRPTANLRARSTLDQPRILVASRPVTFTRSHIAIVQLIKRRAFARVPLGVQLVAFACEFRQSHGIALDRYRILERVEPPKHRELRRVHVVGARPKVRVRPHVERDLIERSIEGLAHTRPRHGRPNTNGSNSPRRRSLRATA
jgi:hypothetical protein